MIQLKTMNLPKKEQVVRLLGFYDLPSDKTEERVFSNESTQLMIDTLSLDAFMGFLLAYGYFYDAYYIRSEYGLSMNTNDLHKHFIY